VAAVLRLRGFQHNLLAKKSTAVSKRRLKALVVDDEKNVRSLLIAWLFREGFLCNEADDGAEALREIGQTHYDLVVADLRMPNRHGHSLCQEILSQGDRPRLVVVTGVDDPRLLRDLQSRGVDHIFQKPVDASEFVSRIRELTQSSASSIHVSGSRSRAASRSNADEHDTGEDSRMPAVALLLHDMRRAQELAAQLKRESLLPFVPESTDALCCLAESRHLEMLVLENSRFGFLRPQDLVSHLKSSTALTEIILLGDENAPPGAVSGGPSAPKVISRHASDAEVVQAVRGKIAAMNRSRRTVSPQARELVRPFASLSSAQQSLLKLAKFLTLPESELKPDGLADEVMADADATVEILRLAKGASAGLRGQIGDVMDAITRLGVTRSAALLVCSGIKGAEKPLLRRMPLPLREWYQRRSALNAAFAAAFAQKYFGLSGDVAFIQGLLQDIGIAALGATFEDRYARLVSRARACGPAHLHVVEREDLRIEHSEISAALIEQWGLPDEFVRTVRFHHGPKAGGTETLQLIDPMRIAESVADLCDNRHACRRQDFFQQLVSCCDGGLEESLGGLEGAAALASEIAQQFRVPLSDEPLLRGIFRELRDPAASTAI
jgi:HD-like signal output (HDOD) protein/DNA-binding response OmpR family regulator